MRFRLQTAALLSFLFGSVATAATLTAEDLWDLKQLGPPAVSPDGESVAVVVSGFDFEANKWSMELWVLPSDGGAGERLSEGLAGNAVAWSSDGTTIAYIGRPEGERGSQLFLRPVAGGAAERLTDVPGGVAAPKFLPGGSRVVFVTSVFPGFESFPEERNRFEKHKNRATKAMEWDKAPVRWWDRWLDEREPHLFSVSVDGGEPVPITVESGLSLPRRTRSRLPGTDVYDISPDGDEVVFVANDAKTGVRPNFDLYVVPSYGGEAQNITLDNRAADLYPRYSPNGRWIAFSRQTTAGFDGDTRRLMLFNRRSRGLENLTLNWDRSAEMFEWSPDSKTLFGVVDDAGLNRVYRFDKSGGMPRAMTTITSVGSIAIAGRGPVLVGLEESFTQPRTLVRINPRSGRTTKISIFNDGALNAIWFGRYESQIVEGAGSEPLGVWINYPPDFNEERCWPVVVLLHGGPHRSAKNEFHRRWNAQLFASWGYVVVSPNFHGSSGYGHRFADSITRNPADFPYEDAILLARWLSDQVWVDPGRMAAAGASFGGFIIAVLQGRTHPFRTLIGHATLYDRISEYAADYGADKRRHGEQWEQPEFFRLYSPHDRAAGFRTPMLLTHGARDYRIPLEQSLELFNTLQNRGVRSRLIVYPDEGHWISKPPNSVHWYASIRDWLSEQLAPVSAEEATQ
ncbi:MAG: S9 family peptidase [Gammaproteobacteria bacterium]